MPRTNWTAAGKGRRLQELKQNPGNPKIKSNSTSFGERIRFVRGNLSRDKFGELMGAHRNTVREWVIKKTIPFNFLVVPIFPPFLRNSFFGNSAIFISLHPP